eukprot:scaffold178668_cov21-Tisochrysis_lutea.AAC.1
MLHISVLPSFQALRLKLACDLYAGAIRIEEPVQRLVGRRRLGAISVVRKDFSRVATVVCWQLHAVSDRHAQIPTSLISKGWASRLVKLHEHLPGREWASRLVKLHAVKDVQVIKDWAIDACSQ